MANANTTPTKQPPRIRKSFVDIGKTYLDAIAQNRQPDAERYFKSIMAELDKFRTDVFASISGDSTTNSTTPIGNGTLGSATTIVDSNQNPGSNNTQPGNGVFKAFEATVMAGQNVIPGSALYVNGNGAAVLATATDNAKYCNAICLGGTGQTNNGLNRVSFLCGGFLKGLHLARVTQSGQLYLSVVPGNFTDDPAESPDTKKFIQYCGVFHRFVTNSALNPTGIFEGSFTLTPPMNFGG